MRLRVAAWGTEAALRAREWGTGNTSGRRRPLVARSFHDVPTCAPATYSCTCALYESSRRWLTELSVRKTEEEKNAEPQPQGCDEDGPPSSDGGQEEVNDFTDDDESMSGASEPPPEPPELTPPTEKYTGYFERQREVPFLE